MLACALLLVGCELDGEVALTVDRDGAGEIAVRLEADDELVDRAEAAGVDPFATLAGADLGAWSSDAEDLTGGGRAVTVRGTFDDSADLAALSEDLAGALDAPELRVLEPFAVELADDTVTLTGGAGLQPTAAVAELGLDTATAVSILDEAVGYTVTATLPGPVLESNADTVDGERATWTIAAGERVDLRVVAERPPPWWWWPAIVGGALLLVGLALGWAWRRRRRRRTGRGAHAA